MTPENTSLSSSERFLLAARVNKFCSIEPGDDFDLAGLSDDAQKIVKSFDSALKVSDDLYFGVTSRRNTRSFGGLASTGNGQFQTNLEGGGDKKSVRFGHIYEDRIGLYKVTKSDEDDNFALNFSYFMEQVSSDKTVVGIGHSTHILYDKKDHLVKAVIKSKPMLLKFINYKIIWYKQLNICGKGKLKSLKVDLFT